MSPRILLDYNSVVKWTDDSVEPTEKEMHLFPGKYGEIIGISGDGESVRLKVDLDHDTWCLVDFHWRCIEDDVMSKRGAGPRRNALAEVVYEPQTKDQASQTETRRHAGKILMNATIPPREVADTAVLDRLHGYERRMLFSGLSPSVVVDDILDRIMTRERRLKLAGHSFPFFLADGQQAESQEQVNLSVKETLDAIAMANAQIEYDTVD